MNLRQLDAFRATMRCGSITGAAQILNISQPSVSRLIGDLEANVGFPLFLRAGRGLVSTVEARRFHQGIESMFVGLEKLEDLANSIRSTSGGVVSVGMIASLAMMEVPRAVRSFTNQFPNNQVMLSEHNTPSIVNSVQTQKFDLGIVGRQPPYLGVETLFQTSVPYICVLPEEHPCANDFDTLDLEEYADKEEFITFGGAFPDEMAGLDPELSKKLQNKSRFSATNMPVAAQLVRTTGAFALVDPFSAETAVRIGGVVSRPLKQQLTYNIAIITRGRDTISHKASVFASIMENNLRQRLDELKTTFAKYHDNQD